MTPEVEEDDEPLIFICRDIPGPHTGGPNCFCCPTVVSAFETNEQIIEKVRRDALKQ